MVRPFLPSHAAALRFTRYVPSWGCAKKRRNGVIILQKRDGLQNRKSSPQQRRYHLEKLEKGQGERTAWVVMWLVGGGVVGLQQAMRVSVRASSPF